MNYYERHLGDYAKDTGHLSMLEHGAYNLLLDRYYATESGIPADQAYRIGRARTKEERDAVDAVLAEFFTLNAGLWTKGRVEEEIASAQQRIAVARENGKAGGRPRKKTHRVKKENPPETHRVSSGFVPDSEIETQTKALQSPDSRHQSPEEEPLQRALTSEEARAEGSERRILPEGEMAIALRDKGVQVTSQHPLLLAWLRDGFTTQQAVAAVAIARIRKPHPEAIPAAYLDPILREPQPASVTPIRPRLNLKTAEELEAMERARGDYAAH